MIAQYISFLYEIGFSEIQIEIYKYLLAHKSGTINDIKTELNFSYTQVYHNLLYLEEKELVESSSDTKPKVFIRKNPKIALTALLNKRYDNFKENVEKLDDELKIQDSKYGRCLKDISFFHYSDLNLAIENFYELIENTQREIVMTSLPPSLLKKLEPSLYDAFMRGVRITLYFSLLDFEVISSYMDIITTILKRIRIELIQTEQMTCQVIRYNDDIVNMGNILLDEDYLNSIIFKENDIYHIDGFRGPFARQAKDYLKVLTVIKRLEIEYPEPIKRVLELIKETKTIKTRDIGKLSKMGGVKIRGILDFLINEGIIKETVKKEDKVGRPRRLYSINEQYISS
ncbi:MAG: helix-turn-helix domain-containing protein [Candidatus Heimdallarchaeota archaeon]